MAKSLRSKTKRAFRKIKREDPKSDYHIRDKLRLQRLNEKLKVLTPVSDDEHEDVDGEEAEASMQEEGSTSNAGAAAQQQGDSTAGPSTTSTSMETDESNPPKKVSTGGPRESARLEWRKMRGLPPKKRTSANSTTFTKPKNYKSPGRAKRARK
ncbi:hypothetical protein P389DRAFT_77529 [Cystobasidium minutum MCA 4210]|uniref:uncharacterized protein n=1 Tax=Cystobasidium minutum MCA 4210 TaxID=1397322 RepID=UPI0034CED8B0|eukprot:jgi/Rhomi1/77529/CE77528_778